jgi:hypothetical protein
MRCCFDAQVRGTMLVVTGVTFLSPFLVRMVYDYGQKVDAFEDTDYCTNTYTDS